MTEENLQMLTAVAAIIAAVAGPVAVVFAAYLTAKLNRVERNVDGKLEDLLKAREDAAGAKGELKERNAQREHEVYVPIEDVPLKVELVKRKEGDSAKTEPVL